MKNPFYSLLRNKILVDIVSDLHIDNWCSNYNKYPCNNPIHYPFDYTNPKSDYLIIAGDISDDIDLSIDYVNQLSQYYKHIMFIDGNHEHVAIYPELYTNSFIQNKIEHKIQNNKITYLSNKPYIINDTVFIGSCGWWDYNNCSTECIDANLNYFDKWIKHFTREDNINFINNVTQQSLKEYYYLHENIKKYENDKNIKNIVVVTHTVPKKEYCYLGYGDIAVCNQVNTKYSNLFKYKKISHWIFGHAHNENDNKENIYFVSNPRGRKSDYNRVHYNVKQIEI